MRAANDLVLALHPKRTPWVSARESNGGPLRRCRVWQFHTRDAPVLSPGFGSGGDRRGAIGCEIVPPQRDGEGDDSETAYNDCPRLGTKPLEPLRIELDRAEGRRRGDDPTAVGVRRPRPNGDDDDGPADDERDLRHM